MRDVVDHMEMPLWEHLEVLRWTLIRILIAWAIGVLTSFMFIPSLFNQVVLAPSREDFFLYRFLAKLNSYTSLVPDFLEKPFQVEVINIKLASQFFIHMSLSFWTSLLIIFPYMIYEIWKFICPALYDNERIKIRWAFVFGTFMFFLGCVVGYSVVFPLTLRFLYTYELSSFITNQLTLDSYMNNFLMLVFMMGIMFELPLLAALFSKLGLLTRTFFKKYWRYAIVILLTVAAVITPSSDPFTLMAVFIPIYMLWEMSAWLVKADDVPEE